MVHTRIDKKKVLLLSSYLDICHAHAVMSL